MKFTQHSAGGQALLYRRFGRAARGCLLGVCLMAVAAGCVALPAATLPAPIPLAAPAPVECPVEKVSVVEVRWFQDPLGAWRVVGMIDNQWDQAVSKIVTSVEALDASGKVIDHGEDVSAYPLNLQPGARSPFIAWISRDFPAVDHFRVAVEECIVAEALERTQIEVRGDRMLIDSAGRAHITGELVNSASKPVLVNGLMASVLDASGAPLAANNATVSARYLIPGEHGPLRVTLYLPPDGAALARHYRLYMDTVVTEARAPLIDSARDLRLTSRYVDADGHFHLAGEVTNRRELNLTLRLQGTVYDDAARTSVADVATMDTTSPLRPGETRSFDLSDWGPLNAQRGLGDELLARDAEAEVRIEPLQSWSAPPNP